LAENRYEEYDDGDDDESEMDMDAVRW
jgi:hypothetical protein